MVLVRGWVQRLRAQQGRAARRGSGSPAPRNLSPPRPRLRRSMSAPMRWDPAQYDRYSDERSRPFFELIARVRVDDPHRVVDIGCGPGGLTRALFDRWPNARVT